MVKLDIVDIFSVKKEQKVKLKKLRIKCGKLDVMKFHFPNGYFDETLPETL